MILHLKVLRQNQKKAILKSAKRSVLNYWYLLNHCGLMIFMRIIQKRSFFRCSYIRAIPKATASGIFWQVLTVPWLPFFQSSGCSVVAKRRKKGSQVTWVKKRIQKPKSIFAKFYGIARNLKKEKFKKRQSSQIELDLKRMIFVRIFLGVWKISIQWLNSFFLIFSLKFS